MMGNRLILTIDSKSPARKAISVRFRAPQNGLSTPKCLIRLITQACSWSTASQKRVIMRIVKENTLGLVIDYQERLLPHITENQQLLANTLVLIKGLMALGIPLVVTEQYRKGLGITVPEIKNVISPFNPMEKVSFSCCDDPGFRNALAETGQKFVVICGIEAHVCVLQTAIDLIKNNYVPVVVADCISSRTLGNKQTAIERMRQEGVIITSCESILFELCRFAGTDQFKAISKLVK